MGIEGHTEREGKEKLTWRGKKWDHRDAGRPLERLDAVRGRPVTLIFSCFSSLIRFDSPFSLLLVIPHERLPLLPMPLTLYS